MTRENREGVEHNEGEANFQKLQALAQEYKDGSIKPDSEHYQEFRSSVDAYRKERVSSARELGFECSPFLDLGDDLYIETSTGEILTKEGIENKKEEDFQKLQALAQEYKDGSIEARSEKSDILWGLADKYVEKNASDVEYHNQGNTDYVFIELPGGLFLQGDAHIRQNRFGFSGEVLTKEEVDTKIQYLKDNPIEA